MVLSDATIRRLVAEGRIGIEPYEEALLQPSSVDVRVDRYFRVFRNNRYPFIDVKQQQEELTELVEIDPDDAVHPPSRASSCSARRSSGCDCPDDLVARLEGKSLTGQARAPDPLDRRVHRPGLGRARHARAVERREPADHDLRRDEDRAALVHAADRARASGPTAAASLGSKYQGQQRPDAEPLLAELRTP